MTARDRLRELLAELGRRTGLGELAPDQNGVCALDFEGRLVLHLFAEQQADQATLYASLGPLPVERQAALHRAMLEANIRDGLPGALGLDPRTGEAMLLRHDSLLGMDYVAFERLLEQLVATGLAWCEKIGRDDGTTVPSTPEVSDARLIMGLGIRA